MKKFFYRVQNKDTVLSLSLRFNVPLFKIIELNGLTKEIQEGDVLYLESEEKKLYIATPFDTVNGVCEKFNIEREEFINKNGNVLYLFYGVTLLTF